MNPIDEQAVRKLLDRQEIWDCIVNQSMKPYSAQYTCRKSQRSCRR